VSHLRWFDRDEKDARTFFTPLFVLLAAFTCAGTWAASQVRSMRDRSEVAQMTEKMRTVCVGRYLVENGRRVDDEWVAVKIHAHTEGLSLSLSDKFGDALRAGTAEALSLELQGGISQRPGGRPVDTSLHEDAVLTLWDGIASSIRLRKTDGSLPPGPWPNSAAQSARQLVVR
jgi:hypothetical protein